MKLSFLALGIAAAAFLSSCGGDSAKEETTETTTEVTEAAEPAEAVTYTVDAAASVVEWKGEVAGVYGHNGVISIKEGTVEVTGGKITGGNVVIDMTTIVPTDSASYNEEKKASDLVAHLTTGDFFLVEEFPTASLALTGHEEGKAMGDLTIRGNTNAETMELTAFEATDDKVSATGVLVFDRQKYDVAWVHFMKDMVLSDDIEVKFNIVANK